MWGGLRDTPVDLFTIADKTFSSRLIVGTGKYSSPAVMVQAHDASGGQASEQTRPRIEVFPVPQLVAPGEVASRPLLPSFRYHPADDELTGADLALGFAEPNYHLFFNETVEFTGPDSASARSQSLYMVPGEGGVPQAAMMAQYDDELVREGGRWKFARRAVRGLMPAPPAPR
jgi:hypothetical protein